MFEFFYFPKLTKEKLSSFVYVENNELVITGHQSGKGVFFLSAHYSDWELIAFAYPRLQDHPLNIIAKIQASRGLNERINEYRSLSGNHIIEIGFSLKEIFTKLKKNEFVCFLIDQSADPAYSTFVNFFGHEVPAFSGPAKLALRYRPELLIGYGLRQKNYSYKTFFERINYDDLANDDDANVTELTQRMQTALEKIIRQDPGQWLWLHKRFKHMRR